MEYVAGPSLRQLLDQSPAGLGEQKTAFFLREIGKGLSFLHDNGIVHRDLKPANVFYENGYVKIGDYGLSKLINPTQNSAQTVTVGTVHYMAPEIGAGKYDRSIDIYALGAVLYEMQTGMVPFNGASPSEVLMKHLSSEPDLSNVPEPFAAVIKKAMAKDPAQRYQSVQEMVEAVFGAEHVRQSVSVFSPDELSVVAARVAAPVGGGATGSSKPDRKDKGSGNPWEKFGAPWKEFGERMADLGDRMADFGWRATANAAGISSHTMAVEPTEDTIDQKQRRGLALITIIAVGLAAGILNADHSTGALIMFPVMLTMLGGAVGIRRAVRRLGPCLTEDLKGIHRLCTGGLATCCAALFSFPLWISFYMEHSRRIGGTWLAIMVPLFCMNAALWADPRREHRVSFWDNAFLAGLFGAIASSFFDGESMVAGLTLVGICLATQLLSPWSAAAARKKEPSDQQSKSPFAGFKIPPIPPVPPIPPIPPFPAAQFGRGNSAANYSFLAVPRLVRVLWLVGMLISLAAGITLLIVAGLSTSSDISPVLCTGLGCVGMSLIFLIQACRSRIYGWWRYLIKPMLITACMICILFAATALGGNRLNPTGQVVMIFLTVFPAIALLTVLFIPGPRRWPSATAPAPAQQPTNMRLRIRRRIRSPFSTLTGLFLFVAALLTLGVAMNVPEAIAVGLPDRSLAVNMATNYFAGYPQWPELLLRLGVIGASLLTVLSIAALCLDRRGDGVIPILRGIAGILLVVFAASLVSHAFHPSVWSRIAEKMNEHGKPQPVVIVADFLDAFERAPLILAAAVFCGGQILLNWMPRKLPAAENEPDRVAA
jgi:hypothetical protein